VQPDEAARGWGGDECDKVGVCIVLDRPGDWKEFEASEAKQMNELLTTLHLEVVILDLKIKMLEAIESGYYDLAMTYQLLILVRSEELNAHKFAMPAKQWSVYRTMSP
jgi:hypothetical protein